MGNYFHKSTSIYDIPDDIFNILIIDHKCHVLARVCKRFNYLYNSYYDKLAKHLKSIPEHILVEYHDIDTLKLYLWFVRTRYPEYKLFDIVDNKKIYQEMHTFKYLNKIHISEQLMDLILNILNTRNNEKISLIYLALKYNLIENNSVDSLINNSGIDPHTLYVLIKFYERMLSNRRGENIIINYYGTVIISDVNTTCNFFYHLQEIINKNINYNYIDEYNIINNLITHFITRILNKQQPNREMAQLYRNTFNGRDYYDQEI
jgi:hypothetical protein